MILLVEDNANEADLTLRALKRNNLGDNVFVARDGVEALDFLFCRDKYADRDPLQMPDLILLDLKLRKVNGLEVLQQVRADERTCRLPIVILSSSNEISDIAMSYQYGASSYIRKPVDFLRFSKLIQQISSYWLEVNLTPHD